MTPPPPYVNTIIVIRYLDSLIFENMTQITQNFEFYINFKNYYYSWGGGVPVKYDPKVV